MRNTSRTVGRATRLATAAGTAALAATALMPATAASASVAAAGGSSAPAVSAAVPDGVLMSYVVNTRANAGQTQKAERVVRQAGGTVIQSWPEIGVVVAQSTVGDFRARVLKDRVANAIDSVGATRTTAVTKPEDTILLRPKATPPPEGTTYDVVQTKAVQAHKVNKGAGVLVAVIDSGIEDTHEDLAANFDAAASASCVQGGKLDRTPGAWRATNSDHGTHVAGTIAADDNGKGVLGMAPDARISSVKVVDENGYIYPEYAICGFVHTAHSGASISNSSYYIDPWQYWCPEDADQAASIEAVRRAVDYATGKGVLSVAAAGNDYRDLANKGVDDTSPNDSTTVTRTLTPGCVDMPTELPGVVTVSSTTSAKAKSSFSNYGLGVIDVAAPGSAIWSTVTGGTYGSKNGTSMASPHAAGVAALLKATHPTATPAQLLEMLRAQADDQPCGANQAAPAPRPTQVCTGTTAYNSFFGDGIVDALDAVTAP